MSDGPVNADDLEWTEHDHGDRQFKRKKLAEAAGGEKLGASLYEVPAGKRLWVRHYSGSEAKAHPFTGGMKPTTGNLSTLIATAGVRCLRNIFR